MRNSLFPFIPFLLLVIPILEIGVFIIIGGQIGIIYTLLGIVLTALIGTILLRQQGFALLTQAQSQMDQGKIPGKELAHGVMLLAAGLLLLTPGFVTDSFGFLLLVPSVRDAIFGFFKSRVTFAEFSSRASSSGSAGGQTYYESYHYSNSSTGQDKSDPSIIDLDESEFDEVGDHPSLQDKSDTTAGTGKGKNSPWHKN